MTDTTDALSLDRSSRKNRRPSLARCMGVTLYFIWAIALVAIVYTVCSGWDSGKVAKFAPRYLEGAATTLSLVSVSASLGFALSLVLVRGLMSQSSALSWTAWCYVHAFRGTPLLAQLFLIYYGLGSYHAALQQAGLWWFFREPWNCGLLALTLNTAAYQTEILRGAIESVPRGQWEAARSLSLSKTTTMQRVILPQALIIAVRPYGNEVILLVKGSAIVAIISVFDLMGHTRYAFSQTFDYQTYIWAAIFYMLIVGFVGAVVNQVERFLTRHLSRATPGRSAKLRPKVP